MCRDTLIIAATTLAAITWASSAAAQTPLAPRPSTLQVVKLDDAVRLAREGDFAAALAIYDEMVVEIGSNVVHLNRGRVLQKMGRCADAKAAFSNVPGAPGDREVTKAALEKRLARYLGELRSSCPGNVTLTCPYESISVATPAGPAACEGLEFELPAGEHTVEGELYGQTLTASVTVVGTEAVEAKLVASNRDLVAIGRKLINLGNASLAKRFLEEALRYGETQELYLYIAEALMIGDRCQAADVALSEASKAPVSGAISPVEFASRLSDQQTAFSKTCGERVRVTCKPAEMNLKIDGGSPQVCSPSPIFLSAGEHRLVAEVVSPAEGVAPRAVRRFVVESGKVTAVEVNLTPAAQTLEPMTIWGIATSAAGVATLGGALYMDLAVVASDIDDYDAANATYRNSEQLIASRDRIELNQTFGKILFVAGGTLTATGAALILYEYFDDDEEAFLAPSTALLPWVSGSRVGVALEGGF